LAASSPEWLIPVTFTDTVFLCVIDRGKVLQFCSRICLDDAVDDLLFHYMQHMTGTLFRTRFRGAQFIVVMVLLKEGLFTNANVLFRTRFRDGTSIVERKVQHSGSTL
jgi:hypothetical protein